MKPIKYIGMDVHKAMTVIAILDSTGKVLAEAIIETKGSTLLDFLKSQRGTLHKKLSAVERDVVTANVNGPFIL